MRTKHFLSAALLAMATFAGGFAQSYECDGCPELSARPTANLSTKADLDGNLNAQSTILTCDTTWILDGKIYVPAGKSLTILPGTVVKALETPTFGSGAAALIVTREGKIYANGTECCPIVFTSADDPLDGSFDIYTQSKWGGIIILGKAHNTVLRGEFNPENPSFQIGDEGSAGLGIIEGVEASDDRHWYGAAIETTIPGEVFNNQDNSGSLRYVSIRHGGSQLGTANEINGLTLGSVGNGTTLRNIEVVSNYDDAIEFFGGTVDLKYARLLYNGDDNIDWDQGYTGRIQHVVVVQADVVPNDPPNSQPGFSGIEADGDDDDTDSRAWLSDPIVSNLTMIGNGAAGNDRALRLKEDTKGEIYNSIFVNFEEGIDFASDSEGPGVECTIENSSFVNMYLNNVDGTPAPGFDPLDPARNNTFVASYNGMTNSNWTPGTWDAQPLSNATDVLDVTDFSTLTEDAAKTAWYGEANYYDFFDPTTYRGAFDPNAATWWSQANCEDLGGADAQGSSFSSIEVPTDVNNDGVTNVDDIVEVLNRFGLSNDE